MKYFHLKYTFYFIVRGGVFLNLLMFFPFMVQGDDHPKIKVEVRPPNIVFILADDLGWGELSSYGNKFNETPNLDNLTSKGKKFTNAYAAAPVCSPTRASIMTGQYPARVRITDYLELGPNTDRFLNPDKYITINEALQSKGYHTGIVGKWHLETHFDNPLGGPEAHGFHEVIGSETEYIAGGDYFYPYKKVSTYNTGSAEEYLTDRQSNDAADFIKRNKTKPFFLYLSYYSVHTRLDAPKVLVDKYKKKYDEKYGKNASDIFERNPGHESNSIDNPYLAAMLERIDSGVGTVMQALKEAKLDENTIVVFTSDNGGAGRVANNGNLRANKTWLYEGGIRVPLIISWPKQISKGEIKEPVSSIDFYPTFVSASGGDIKNYQLDGENLIPLLKEETNLERKELYFHYPADTKNWTDRMATVVRQGNYKLIKHYLGNKYELFNLEKDPSENNNLATKMSIKVKELAAMIDIWKMEVNAEEPNAEALKKATSATSLLELSSEAKAQKRLNELKVLELSDKQVQKIYDLLLTFYKNDEELRKRDMNLQEKLQAQRDNNKNTRGKFGDVLSSEQMEKLRSLRKSE